MREELAGRGFLTPPVTFVDGTGYYGFDPETLTRVLGITAPMRRAAASGDMLEQLDRILVAWVRAVRQLPASALDLPVDPKDGRELLGTFALKIPNHVRVTMRARETGVWDAGAAERYEQAPDETDDPGEIADHVEQLRRDLAEWRADLVPGELGSGMRGGYGDVELSRLVEISLTRQAFQLRRLYAAMRRLGVEPEEPIDDAELERLGTPERVIS